MKIHVDANVDGEKYFNGELSYIEDDKLDQHPRRYSSCAGSKLPTLTESKPEIERNSCCDAWSQGEHQVELTIHPHQGNRGARNLSMTFLMDLLSCRNTHGAEFSFTEQNANFQLGITSTDSSGTISPTKWVQAPNLLEY